ncbi:thiol:disulfide interchange protein DsbG [Piscinibacter sakaiensis]|uniref:thiol:disulfide interchange protein DsbG n=1 Tax=Piscinibacter sakaiensis TaxID=1547922 RepID=UPI003AACAEFA
MKISTTSRRLLTATMFTASFGACAADELPPALQSLQKQGIGIAGSFQSKTGLKAYAASAGGRPITLYVTPNGHVIAGTALGADGDEVDSAALEAALRKPLPEQAWKQLEASRWIADGKPNAPRIVYVFTDPNCPFCAKFWADARPWVDSGKVQLRHVIVGVLTPTSRAKAAALLADSDPAQALAAYEGRHAPAIAKTLAAGGRPQPVGDGGLTPLKTVPPAIATQLDANERLMGALGIEATPGVVWRDAKGAIQKRTGVPDPALVEILGPK